MQDICGKLFDKSGHTFCLIFLKQRPDARLNVTLKQYATFRNPKMYPHTKVWVPTSHNIQICSGPDLSRTEARGQRIRDPKTIGGTLQPIDVTTYQIGEFYVILYRGYAL